MKNILLLTLTSIFFFVACKEKEPIPNRPPGEFTVKSTLGTDGKTVTLNWTKAIDPDGDSVTYAVVLGDTLIKNITETTYKISSLDYDFRKEGEVIAMDIKGLKTTAGFTAETSQNKAPSDFTVIPNLEKDGRTVTLKWTKAIDPNGDIVKYNVVLGKDTLVKGLSDTVFVIKSLEYEYSGTGLVTALDPKGLKASSSFLLKTSSEFFSINDIQFEAFLVDYKYDTDKQVDGKMLKKDAEMLTTMYFPGWQYNVQDISIFQRFQNLEELSLTAGTLKNISFDNLPKLKFLYINESFSLDLVDLSKSVSLKKIFLIATSTKKLVLPLNGNIEYLDLEDNKMEVIDLCKLNNITKFYIKDAKYSNEKSLKYIYVKNVDDAKKNVNWIKESAAEYKICN
jgi:hypothetical protein